MQDCIEKAFEELKVSGIDPNGRLVPLTLIYEFGEEDEYGGLPFSISVKESEEEFAQQAFFFLLNKFRPAWYIRCGDYEYPVQVRSLEGTRFHLNLVCGTQSPKEVENE